MGLDQYATARRGEAKTDDEGFTYYEDSIELSYWRKHPNLQGWMEELYHKKGGKEVFNCVDFELTLEDIDQLEAAILNKDLPETGGFFFGNDSYSDYEGEHGYKNYDLSFISKAKEILTSNKKLYYSCWW